MPAIEEVNLIGKRQDLSDALVMTNAADLPFTTMVKKGTAPGNTLLEYPIDKYADARTEGVPDGQDASAFEDTQANRALCRSRVMKQWRNPMVTDLAENVTDQAGDGGSKFAQAKAKAAELAHKHQQDAYILKPVIKVAPKRDVVETSLEVG